MKISFNSDDKLPLNKQLKFLSVIMVLSVRIRIIRSVIEDDGKYYPQALLEDRLEEL